MHDDQYPHLHPLDGRPIPDVPEHIVRDLKRIGSQVFKRTGCSGWYHQAMRGVQWHLGPTPRGGPVADILFQGDRYIPIDVEQTTKRIQMAINTPRKEKDRQMAKAKRDRKIEEEYERAARARDLAPELRDRFKYNVRKMEAPNSNRVFTFH